MKQHFPADPSGVISFDKERKSQEAYKGDTEKDEESLRRRDWPRTSKKSRPPQLLINMPQLL